MNITNEEIAEAIQHCDAWCFDEVETDEDLDLLYKAGRFDLVLQILQLREMQALRDQLYELSDLISKGVKN